MPTRFPCSKPTCTPTLICSQLRRIPARPQFYIMGQVTYTLPPIALHRRRKKPRLRSTSISKPSMVDPNGGGFHPKSTRTRRSALLFLDLPMLSASQGPLFTRTHHIRSCRIHHPWRIRTWLASNQERLLRPGYGAFNNILNTYASIGRQLFPVGTSLLGATRVGF